MGDAPDQHDAPRRARRRWRVAANVLTVPLIISRLQRSKVLALGREDPLRLREQGMLGHANYLRKLSLGARIGGVVENGLVDVRIDRAVKEAAMLSQDSSSGVVTVVGSEAEVDANAWWKQGDMALATRAKFEERFKLRHAPQVNKVLHAFWLAAIRGSGDAERRAYHADSPGLLEVTIGFEEYFALFDRVYRTLLDDHDPEDAERTIREDFEKDAKGDDVLTNSEYGDALFELGMCARPPAPPPWHASMMHDDGETLATVRILETTHHTTSATSPHALPNALLLQRTCGSTRWTRPTTLSSCGRCSGTWPEATRPHGGRPTRAASTWR
jgi:hypothetical protein